MADLIRLLPDHVANQIAAGEVVQRPASVVKELLENSIDSGATKILLVIKDAGRTLVQVTDDGRGMGPNDARMCFERHATSKIKLADDLSHIRTKGFRGEALASIAAVAHVEMRTREHDQELGTLVVIEGSRLRAQEIIATPAGTTICVQSLFFNVPARRQFLKSDGVEMKHVLEEFMRVALAHPEIGFKLMNNDQEEFNLPGSNAEGSSLKAEEESRPGLATETRISAGLRQRIVHLFGRKYDERLVPVEETTELISVTGFIGKPEFAKRSRGEQYIFVNRRFIRSSYLEHALRKAYDELVSRENYPSWFLNIDLDPAQIDINIHPTKTEIKFRDDRMVYAIVHAAARRALGRFNIVPSLDFEPEPAIISAFSGGSAMNTTAPSVPPWRPHELGAFSQPPRRNVEGWQQLFDLEERKVQAGAPAAPDRSRSQRPEIPGERLLFQLHGIYIIAPLKSGLMVVDQHRAHERVLYERNLKMLEIGAGTSQTELFPRIVELNAGDHSMVEELLPDLRTMGFDLQPFGGRSFQVNGMPAEAADEDPTRLLEGMLEQVKNEKSAFKNDRHQTLARSLARSMAMKGGRSLSTAEMHDLIDRLFACEMPYLTAGGKPTLITFGLDELAQRFER